MKRIIALSLAFIMLLSIASCGGGNGDKAMVVLCDVCDAVNPAGTRLCGTCGAALTGNDLNEKDTKAPTELATEDGTTDREANENFETEDVSDKIVCPNCGSYTSVGFFCMMCGHSLTETETDGTDPFTEIESEDISSKVICPHCGGYTASGYYCEKCGEGLIVPELTETEETEETEEETLPLDIVAECNLCGGSIVRGNKRCLDCGRISIVINGNPDASDVSSAPVTNSYSLIKINDDNSIGFTVQKSTAMTGSMQVDNPNFIKSEECPVILVLMRNYCACGRTSCDISYEGCSIEITTSKTTMNADVNYGYSERIVGEDRYISFISTDISSKGITGNIRGCGLTFNAVGEYLFDLCFVGFFETKEDALNYMDDYLQGGSEADGENHPASVCHLCGTTKRDTQKSCRGCGKKSLFISADTENSDLLVAPVFADAKEICINEDKSFGITTKSSVTESGEILIYNPAGMTHGECPVILVLAANYCDCGQNTCIGEENCVVSVGGNADGISYSNFEIHSPPSTLKNSYVSFIYDLSRISSVKSEKIDAIDLSFSTENEMQFDICFVAFFESVKDAEGFLDGYVEDAWY